MEVKPQLGQDVKPFVTTFYTDMPKMLTSTLSKINIMTIFKTNNNIMNILHHNNSITPLEKKPGVYKLSCDDCDCFYIGQTGRGVLQRFNEHIGLHFIT